MYVHDFTVNTIVIVYHVMEVIFFIKHDNEY